MNKTTVVILALALASPVYGMVFSWTDPAGIKHFTNKRDEIPERYRDKAKHLYPEQADMLPGHQNTQSQPVKPEVPPVVQQAIPAPPKTLQPVVAPEEPKKEIAPATGRRDRRRVLRQEDE